MLLTERGHAGCNPGACSMRCDILPCCTSVLILRPLDPLRWRVCQGKMVYSAVVLCASFRCIVPGPLTCATFVPYSLHLYVYVAVIHLCGIQMWSLQLLDRLSPGFRDIPGLLVRSARGCWHEYGGGGAIACDGEATCSGVKQHDERTSWYATARAG